MRHREQSKAEVGARAENSKWAQARRVVVGVVCPRQVGRAHWHPHEVEPSTGRTEQLAHDRVAIAAVLRVIDERGGRIRHGTAESVHDLAPSTGIYFYN